MRILLLFDEVLTKQYSVHELTVFNELQQNENELKATYTPNSILPVYNMRIGLMSIGLNRIYIHIYYT